MGQAKRRGNREERIAQAKKIIEELMPKEIKCNVCGLLTSEITSHDARGLDGVTGVYVGNCDKCQNKTIAMTGDPQRVKSIMSLLAEGMGLGVDSLKVQQNIRQLSNI